MLLTVQVAGRAERSERGPNRPVTLPRTKCTYESGNISALWGLNGKSVIDVNKADVGHGSVLYTYIRPERTAIYTS